MPASTPYQPLLLRIFHGISGILGILALITGFWVYNTYDRRFGSLPLPPLPDVQGIHGTFGLFFLLGFPLLAIYSFHWGSRRLIQADFVGRLTQKLGQPVWWYTLQRLANTTMLLAATLSVVSGRMMQEAWLPAGELYHRWYTLHLLGWAIFLVALVLHVLMSFKVGGVPLLRSMLHTRYRPDDAPSLWLERLRNWRQW